MRRFALLATIGTLWIGCGVSVPATAAQPRTVRDAMWIWGHYEGSYNNSWGLTSNSPITPIQGARSMGVPNVIMIRIEGKPEPPYDAYATQFQSCKKVMWSIVGGGGATSAKERDDVLALAATTPNMTGVFMDDFFHYGREDPPHWLAQNNVSFPVLLTLSAI